MSTGGPEKVVDGEFRKILAIIKPFIPCVNNNHFLNMYRVWLERLSDVEEADKGERNKYLSELCRQIQEGVLEEPFTEMPLQGLLLPFEKMVEFVKFQNRNNSSNAVENLPVDFEINNENEKRIVYLKNISENDDEELDQNNKGLDKVLEENSDLNCNILDNYTDKTKEIATKKPTNFKRKKVKVCVKPSLSKLNNKNYHNTRQKQKSIYVVQKELCTKTQTNNNLKTVLEEQDHKDKLQKHIYLQEYLQNQDFNTFPWLKTQMEKFNENNIETLIEKYHPNEESTSCIEDKDASVGILEKENSEEKCSLGQQLALQSHIVSECVQKMGNEENSWCDLISDGSSCTVKMGSVDGAGDTQNNIKIILKSHLQMNDSDMKDNILIQIYESRISNMMEVINSLKQENSILNDHIGSCEKQINSMENKKAETSIHNLSNEVTSLRERLKELASTRYLLKQNEFENTNKWKNSVITLKAKYDALLKKNEELKTANENLKFKLEDTINIKEKEIQNLKEKLAESRKKELESLQNSHLLRLKELENSFTEKLILKEKEMSDKLEQIKTEYEETETENKEKYEKALHFKDAEINRLESMIQEQCLRMQKEIKLIRNHMEQNAHLINGESSEKIQFLQKCIFKMEKLFKKSQKDYAKQVAALKRDLNIKNRSIELQLTKQRAELIKNSNSTNKSDFDSLIIDLEERYRILLECQQTQALMEKEKDLRIIAGLRERLAKLPS